MNGPQLDDLDQRLLAELTADARLTQVALAARLGLSRTAIQERMKRLEREGVIQGYTVRLRERRHPGVRAYLLVKDHAPDHERLAQALKAHPEVVGMDSVAGGTDVVLQVQVESVEALSRFRDLVGRLPQVDATETLLVMVSHFHR
ncbi:Lrp/AsnC family transcriptional regulator [Geothrix sp. PMB-07]|uniref:Lrp/AsnC family transcriptional regulator n=1 Tax=Geothrix sp. PMB-07 TaxID=3068640 RepID=UPI002741E22F|nr:Lrp/AsnC family transcriptional regulator [Geothrix sp. PMB-07]WLT30796.1 Lrp/AsnC family transcriptional regulator [Geothrix sp. PMB-07]